MIECGIPADQILMFTFTRKAADEMKTRVEKLIGAKARGITVSTYHSFCGKLLRRYAHIVGLQNNFTIYDEDDSMSVIKEIMAQNAMLEMPDAKSVRNKISVFKEELVNPEEALSRGGNAVQRNIATIYSQYCKYLRKSNALDFDDMPYFAIKALQQSEQMRRQVNSQYCYIIADEIQDSAAITDLTLISLLAGPDPDKWNVMLIGDENQSIYSFRGANVAAFINFIKKYEIKQLHMGQNYRSTKTIVDAAESVIRHNKTRFDKEVFTENEKGTTIKLFTLIDEKAEANKIANTINLITRESNITYNDIAVLYRYRGQSQVIEAEMRKQGIPCKVVSGGSFFSRRVIKDLLSYVRLVVNPYDREAFRRIVNIPHRHIGEASLKAILTYIEEHDNVSVFDACRNVSFRQKETRKGVENFVYVMQTLCEVAHYIDENIDEQDVNAAMLVRETYNIINYGQYIEEYIDDNKDQCESDISTLLNFASEYKSINDFVTAVSENDVKQDSNDDIPCVKLMTLHGSKGLEWPVVFIIGSNNGTIPAQRSVNEGNEEEERRLFFVGMTRAKKLLFLTRAKEVIINGKRMFSMESKFIREIKPEYLKRF